MRRNVFSRLIPTVLLIASLMHIANAQNYSGLQNKELSPDFSKGSIVGGLLEVITNPDFSGTIHKVKVIEDHDISVTLAVTFSGMNDGYVIVQLTDENGKPVKGFAPVKRPIQKDKQEVMITSFMDPTSFTENETFTVPRLTVMLSKTESGTEGVSRMFRLNKKYTKPISPENIITEVALVPVGSARSLPATLPTGNGGNYQLTIPRKNVYEVIKDRSLYMPATRIERPTASASPEPAAPNRVAVRPAMTGVSVLRVNPALTPAVTGNAPATPPSKDPQGPDNKPLSFWGDFIYSDVDFESQMKITNVNLNIYPDKNPHSGVFYYMPIAYDIRFDREKGFAFNVDYGTARGDEQESRVRMSGTLASGISLYEVQFIKNLMDTYKKQNPGLKLEKPLPLPVIETPVITLGDELKNFGITSVNINNVSSITDPIEFSWQTDGTTAAELENLLRVNSGITGKMKIKTTNGDFPMQEIPVRIRLIDENTFGRFGMTPTEFRTKNWRNETPFPVKLKYIHYMIIDKNPQGQESPIIYSWDLNNKEIQPRSQAKFEAGSVPQWLDNYKGKQPRIWIEYSVSGNCAPCNETVFSSIISSTSRPQLSEVVFRMIDFFEAYNIAYMDVEMKSIQGDPNGRSMTTFPVVHITKDKANYPAGKIYLPEGTDPDFDYKITVVTHNGQELTSAWMKRNSLSVPFGSFQLEEIFPSMRK